MERHDAARASVRSETANMNSLIKSLITTWKIEMNCINFKKFEFDSREDLMPPTGTTQQRSLGHP